MPLFSDLLVECGGSQLAYTNIVHADHVYILRPTTRHLQGK